MHVWFWVCMYDLIAYWTVIVATTIWCQYLINPDNTFIWCASLLLLWQVDHWQAALTNFIKTKSTASQQHTKWNTRFINVDVSLSYILVAWPFHDQCTKFAMWCVIPSNVSLVMVYPSMKLLFGRSQTRKVSRLSQTNWRAYNPHRKSEQLSRLGANHQTDQNHQIP